MRDFFVFLTNSRFQRYNGLLEAKMDSSCTIVVPDADTLAKLCGTNDSNLKLIEESLGAEIFARGNELSVEGRDPDIQRRFKFIVDRIIDEIEDGAAASADAVASILNVRAPVGLDSTNIVVPGGLRRVYPKTQNQADYIALMRSRDMVLCEGPAGSGKTFLAIAEALRLALTKQCRGIVLTRPVVEAGESLGFLPGDLEQKTAPYLRPLYDAMETILPRDTVARLAESRIIEAAPLAYMRGRTFCDKILILDEAQNTSQEQMKMFLTRMGSGSKVFITGDMTQVDLPPKIHSGFSQALALLSNVPEIGIMRMNGSDVSRNPLVKKIVKAYQNDPIKN